MPIRTWIATGPTLALSAVVLAAQQPATRPAGDTAPYKNPSLPVADRVSDLLGRMTLDEKVGQMIQADSNNVKPAEVGTLLLGSVLSGGDSEIADITPRGWSTYVETLQKRALGTRLGIPIIYGIDAVHGHNNVRGATVFPHNIGLGCTRNPKIVEEAARITAREVAGTGMHWAFAPCVAVPLDERWGRTYEGFGESPELAATMGPAAVRGLQGADPSQPGRVIASVKHYVGDGGTQDGVDQGETTVDEATLRSVHLAGYGPSIRAGAGTVMASYNTLNGEKMHANKRMLSDVLKSELGFDGFIVSDWKAIEQLPGSFSDQIERSVNAGVDMLMQPDNYADAYSRLKQLAQNGKVSMARVDDAVKRILTVKFRAGLFERPFGDPSLLSKVGSAEHRAVARQAVRESQVLLVNKAGTLPLKKSLTKIAVAGRAADDIGMQCGGWTIAWQGQAGPVTDGTTVLQAIRKAVPAATVTYMKIPGQNQAAGREPAGTGDVPKDAQVGIVVIGEQPYAEMKGDRKSLDLDSADIEAVRKVKEAGIPVVVILFSGRPMILEPILPYADALVAAWLPGSEGDGIADVLFGDYKPTGKLSHTWPKSMAQIPINVGPKGEKPKEQPLFEYGFGLSYR